MKQQPTKNSQKFWKEKCENSNKIKYKTSQIQSERQLQE